MKQQIISVDIVIFGGGIAGLWALNRLRGLGFQCVLFETNTLGGEQTIKSQGIIHGGVKYALSGFLSKAATAIESMPKRWKDCLSGNGEIDLSAVKILSHDQVLYSTGNLSSGITSFFASLALNSRVKKLKVADYPAILKDPGFKGQVYLLDEVVLNPHSLIEVLAKPHLNYIFKINQDFECQFWFEPNNPNNIASLTVTLGNETIQFQAKQYIFAAGAGNEKLASHLSNPTQMQRRPLQMVLVKFPQNLPFYAHCMDNGVNPRITIISMMTRDHQTLWYLGGDLAESGVARSPDQQISAAKQELNTLFPWLDLSQATWSTFFVDRAEPKQPDGKRPDTAFIDQIGNAMVVFPTKLALAPLLSDHIVHQLKAQKIEATANQATESLFQLSHFEKPSITLPLEDALFNSLRSEDVK